MDGFTLEKKLGSGHTAIFLKPPFQFLKWRFDFCRFCWSHRPNSVVLFAKVKFWKVK